MQQSNQESTTTSIQAQRRSSREERRKSRRAAQVSPFKASQFWVEWAPAPELNSPEESTSSKYEFICEAQASTNTCTTPGIVIEDEPDSENEQIMTCSYCGCRVFRGRLHED